MQPTERDHISAVVDVIRDYAIFLVDTKGTVRTWNEGARLIKGYTQEEIVGRSIATFYTPEEAAAGRAQHLLAIAAREGRVEDEGWRVRKDGTRFWADVVITALRDESGALTGFVKVTRDLTARRNAEELLRESEERLRLMLESVRDYAIFMLDVQGRVASWNTGAQRLKGYRTDEIIGRHFSVFYPPEDVEAGKPRVELETATATGRFEDEGWRVRKDGTRFWANVVLSAVHDKTGALVGFTKVTRDLTQRRVVEQELAARAAQQAVIAELGLFALQSANLADLLEHALEAVKTTLATDIVDLVGVRDDGTLVREGSVGWKPAPPPPIDDLGMVRYTLDQGEAVVAPDLAREKRFPISRRRGSAASAVMHGAGTGSPIRGVLVTFAHQPRTFTRADLDFLHAVLNVVATAMARATSERQRHEAERAAAEERIRTSRAQEAVRERDEFISIAAHELRTPLTALNLKLESARHGLALQPLDAGKVAMRVDGAMRQTERLAGLVERLLDVSRIVSGRMELRREPVDLAALVRRVTDDMREQAQRAGCDLVVRVPDSLVVVCDPERIAQVGLNLLSNAIKYGSGKPIDVTLARAGDRAVLSVADHGIGIEATDIDRIFARFERAVPSRHYGGLGLGLYISRRILEAHAGTIRVDSVPGRGSTFHAELPIREEKK